MWIVDPRPGVGERLRHRDPAGSTFRRVERVAVGEDAEALGVGEILPR